MVSTVAQKKKNISTMYVYKLSIKLMTLSYPFSHLMKDQGRLV